MPTAPANTWASAASRCRSCDMASRGSFRAARLLICIALLCGLLLQGRPSRADVALQRSHLQNIAGASFLIPARYITYPRGRTNGATTQVEVDAVLPDFGPAIAEDGRIASAMQSVRAQLMQGAAPSDVLKRLRTLPYYDFSSVDWARPGLQEIPGDNLEHRYVFVEDGGMTGWIKCVRMPDPTAPQQPLPLCQAGVMPYLPGLNAEMSFPAALLPEFAALRGRLFVLLDRFRAEAAARRP
jgi:hypothetical protein